MSKAKNVIDFYLYCDKLTQMIRTGWVKWHVDSDRLESIAEHIYSTSMLALGIWSEYDVDIDIEKVMMMLACHEMEEILIGDKTLFEISRSDKLLEGHEAISFLLAPLKRGSQICDLILEFDERESKEARFSFFVDKFQGDIDSKIHDSLGQIDLNKQEDNEIFYDKRVQKLLQNGNSFSDMWLLFGQQAYHYDGAFLELSNYVLGHDFISSDGYMKVVDEGESRSRNVIDFYLYCDKLKNTIRKGFLDWHVDSDRLESIAEHIYGTMMLALGVWSEYDVDVDIKKVMMMLACHETEEILIGDKTMFDISREEKKAIGHEAVTTILSPLRQGDEIRDLILEFDERESKEARFSFFVDKFQFELKSKIYDSKGCVDLDNQEGNDSFYDERIHSLIEEGKSFSEMMLLFGQENYHYDEEFLDLSNYLLKQDFSFVKSKK